MTLRALFLWNCTLARRHNLTFQKGQLPSFKGLNIDSGWRLIDISFAKNDLTKESSQDPHRCVREKPILHWGALGIPVKTFDRQLSTFSVASQAAFVYWAVRMLWHLSPPPYHVQCDDYIDMTFHEHFTSWICRWQIQLNPKPLLIAALAWQSHCGSCWCPLGALRRQGDKSHTVWAGQRVTQNVFPPSWIMPWAVNRITDPYVNHRLIILIYSNMDFSYS